MNVSRAIIENMVTEQKGLETEIQTATEKLALLVRQHAENEAHIRLARSFGVPTTESSHG